MICLDETLSSRVFLSRSNRQRPLAPEVDRVQIIPHFPVIVPTVFVVVETQLAREILPEAFHLPTIKKRTPEKQWVRHHAPRQQKKTGKKNT